MRPKKCLEPYIMCKSSPSLRQSKVPDTFSDRLERSGKTLVVFVLLLPVLVGWVGLTIDGGLLLWEHRQAQNAADAAALAAARDKLAGRSDSTALATANTYIQQYNGLSGAPDLVAGQTFNIPPKQGAYAGKTQYIEVIVT